MRIKEWLADWMRCAVLLLAGTGLLPVPAALAQTRGYWIAVGPGVATAAARGLSSSSLPSGAGHDSQNMATLAPTGMIFVPSIAGRSHCPEENTSWIDVENGANVLLDTLIQLANS